MLTIDCHSCPARGRHCGDCFVPVLGGWAERPGRAGAPRGPLPLDTGEEAAVRTLLRAGLVSAEAARQATSVAEPFLPRLDAAG